MLQAFCRAHHILDKMLRPIPRQMHDHLWLIWRAELQTDSLGPGHFTEGAVTSVICMEFKGASVPPLLLPHRTLQLNLALQENWQSRWIPPWKFNAMVQPIEEIDAQNVVHFKWPTTLEIYTCD